MKGGKLFVISGASGVGKSTILNLVMSARPDLRFSVSATTRPARKGETEAVSYYFVSKDRFKEMIQNNEFLEYDAHMGNFYGTPKKQLEEKLSQGSVILDIEPNGAFNVRKERPDAVLIFIAPPSAEELEKRLRGRGDTPEDQIRLRLDRVQWEMNQSEKYNYVVVNDQVAHCAQEILNIIEKENGEKI